MTDAELAARLQREPQLFTAVYDRYVRDIYRYVAGRLDTQAADDIAAETFLAALPGVKNLGPVKGGVGLRITFPTKPAYGWIKLVVDPATSLVRSEANAEAVTVIKKAQWTHRLPRVIPLPPKDACGT